MRIVFFGTTEFAAVILRAVAASSGDLLAVVTRPDRPAGRGRRMRESPVKALARELGVATHAPEDPNSAEFVRIVESLEAELLAVAAYGHIFGASLLSAPSRGCVNVHASLLPRYRGAAPIHHALINGETETGITTMWMDERMDGGDMILQRSLPIVPEDDVGSLERKLADLGAEVLTETLCLIEQGRAPCVKQDEAQATYAPALGRARAEIDWSLSAQQVANLVRGTNPTPGAFTFRGGKRLKILRAQAVEKVLPEAGTPGEIVERGDEGLLVRSGVGVVLLLEMQPEGGRAMTGAEYARGYRPQPGEVLGECPGSVTADRLEAASMSTASEELDKHYQQGTAHKNVGEYDEAIAEFRYVLEREPDHLDARIGLGLVCGFVGMFDESLAELRRAVEIAPDCVDAVLYLAKTCCMLGMYDEACAHFERILQLEPEHAEAKKQLTYLANEPAP